MKKKARKDLSGLNLVIWGGRVIPLLIIMLLFGVAWYGVIQPRIDASGDFRLPGGKYLLVKPDDIERSNASPEKMVHFNVRRCAIALSIGLEKSVVIDTVSVNKLRQESRFKFLLEKEEEVPKLTLGCEYLGQKLFWIPEARFNMAFLQLVVDKCRDEQDNVRMPKLRGVKDPSNTPILLLIDEYLEKSRLQANFLSKEEYARRVAKNDSLNISFHYTYEQMQMLKSGMSMSYLVGHILFDMREVNPDTFSTKTKRGLEKKVFKQLFSEYKAIPTNWILAYSGYLLNFQKFLLENREEHQKRILIRTGLGILLLLVLFFLLFQGGPFLEMKRSLQETGVRMTWSVTRRVITQLWFWMPLNGRSRKISEVYEHIRLQEIFGVIRKEGDELWAVLGKPPLLKSTWKTATGRSKWDAPLEKRREALEILRQAEIPIHPSSLEQRKMHACHIPSQSTQIQYTPREIAESKLHTLLKGKRSWKEFSLSQLRNLSEAVEYLMELDIDIDRLLQQDSLKGMLHDRSAFMTAIFLKEEFLIRSILGITPKERGESFSIKQHRSLLSEERRVYIVCLIPEKGGDKLCRPLRELGAKEVEFVNPENLGMTKFQGVANSTNTFFVFVARPNNHTWESVLKGANATYVRVSGTNPVVIQQEIIRQLAK